MKFLYSYLHQQIEEIKNDHVLQIYGALLSLTIPLTILHWFLYSGRSIVTSTKEIICWPFFENCEILRVFDYQQMEVILIVVGLMSFPLAWMFLQKRYAIQAWWFLLLLHLVKYGIILLDYRLRLNQHIMAFWIVLLFLFVPRKKIGISLMLIAFYFWAGILKLDWDWLTASALYAKPWFLDGIWLQIACWYVVILEIILIWGLVNSRLNVRYGTLFQLVLFHIFSASIVGFFYPILMLLLLSVFPLTWYLDPNYKFNKIHCKTAVIIPLIIFSMLQFSTKLYPGDTSITGEGRVFALHMFDAKNTCHAHAKVKLDDGDWTEVELYKPLPPRIHCDPNVYLNRARMLCNKYKTDKKFIDLDLYLEIRGSRETKYQTLVDQKDFCRSDIHYSVWKTNDWIIKN